MNSFYTSEELENLRNTRMIIYMIINLINQKKYVGQTSRTFNQRYKSLGVGVHRVVGCESNSHLASAIQKYGADNFKVEIIEVCNSKEELNERERYYIKLHDTTNPEKGYNYCEGGGNGVRNLTRESKLNKIAKQHKETKPQSFARYLKKMSENGFAEDMILSEILETPLFVEDKEGNVKYFTSLSKFQNSLKKEDRNIIKLHYYYKVSRSELEKELYKLKTYPYVFYREDENNLPPHILEVKLLLKQRREKKQERKEKEYALLNTISHLLEKHGEWESWEEEAFHLTPIMKQGWVVKEDKHEEYMQELTKVIKEEHPYYWEMVFKENDKWRIGFFLNDFYNKIYK